MTGESNQVGVTSREGCFGGVGVKSSGAHEDTSVSLAQVVSGDRAAIFIDKGESVYTRLDNVKVGQREIVQPLGNIAKQCVRITVTDALEGTSRCQTDGNPVRTPH